MKKMPNWTDDQKHAIYARGSNILVSAAAGSGKTTVLVQRVIEMITDKDNPLDIDKLLIVTFTNAAAAEMKSRISKRLREILKNDPTNTNARRQLSLIPNASICTIDSFCINLARENFFNLGIEQDFKIMDNSEKQVVEQNVLDELIGDLYKEDKEEFRILIEMLSSTKSDKMLATTINDISNFINAQEFPNKWLDDICELYNPDISLNDSDIARYVFAETKTMTTFILDLIRESISSLQGTDRLYDGYNEMLQEDKASFENILEALKSNDWDTVAQAVKQVGFRKTPFVRGYTSPSKAIVTRNKDLYKDMLEGSIAPLFSTTKYEYKQDCVFLYPVIKLLTKIVKEYNQRLMATKRELNSYTFGDIEHFAIDLLFYIDDKGEYARTDLAKDYENTFAEILVDEYQDTNSAQDKLFEMLSNGRNRFMVGDVKQSIYRFRLAMPFIFTQKKDSYSEYSEDNTSDSQKIMLTTNYRSRQGICDFTNFVFSTVMSRRVGELEYDESEQLNCGAAYEPSDIPSPQLCFVQTPEGENADEYEARQVAKYIIEKVEGKEKIKVGDNDYREIGYGDFAVLFRSAKKRVPIFSKVFAEYGIPTIANNKVNLFENSEIKILLNLIRVIDNPVQDIPLLATLMSVFYGYSADEIARARVDYPAKNLYSSIIKSDTFNKILEDIKRYREYASSMSVENLIRLIISETSYFSMMSAMGNFEQRMLNVMLLVDIAKKFDNGDNVGLTAFVRYIDTIIKNDFTTESANVTTSIDGAVNLMTIHHSKGLEFPVVILAGTSHRYNNEDAKKLVQINNSCIGLKVHNEERLMRYSSLQYSITKNQNEYADMSENLRVLYVAITRAKEQFVAFISNKNVEKHIDSLSKKITGCGILSETVKKLTNDGDLLTLCAMLHKDGDVLRDMCSDTGYVDVNANFDMLIKMCNYDIGTEDIVENIATANNDKLEEIKERLSFRYDRLSLANYTSKRTASSLDEKEHSFKYLTSSKPAFLNKSNMTAAQKGTAMHAFMQYCSYDLAKDNLENEITRLTDNNYITDEQANSLDRKLLNNLFTSDFANRMFSSDRIYREIKVSTFVPVNELEETDYTDSVLVQGIADCVFEENGELVLVDYKTDKVDSEEELLSRYEKQIGFYKNAVAKTLQKPVKEAILYSFSLNKVCVYK